MWYGLLKKSNFTINISIVYFINNTFHIPYPKSHIPYPTPQVPYPKSYISPSIYHVSSVYFTLDCTIRFRLKFKIFVFQFSFFFFSLPFSLLSLFWSFLIFFRLHLFRFPISLLSFSCPRAMFPPPLPILIPIPIPSVRTLDSGTTLYFFTFSPKTLLSFFYDFLFFKEKFKRKK